MAKALQADSCCHFAVINDVIGFKPRKLPKASICFIGPALSWSLQRNHLPSRPLLASPSFLSHKIVPQKPRITAETAESHRAVEASLLTCPYETRYRTRERVQLSVTFRCLTTTPKRGARIRITGCGVVLKAGTLKSHTQRRSRALPDCRFVLVVSTPIIWLRVTPRRRCS